MNKRILTFKKTYAKDLGDSWHDADIIQIGHDRITVRDIVGTREEYTGTLCFNSRSFATFTGGNNKDVEITPKDIPSSALMKSIELNINSFEGKFSGIKLKLTLTWATHLLAMTRIRDMEKLSTTPT